MSTNRRIHKFTKPAAPSAGEPVNEAKPIPFPLHLLPPAAKAMGAAICHTERTPESLVGSCLLGIISGAIGAGLQVKSGPNRFTRGNLFLMVSGESASGKSETFRHAIHPFREFENELHQRWETDELPGLLAEKELLESEIGHLKKRKSPGPVEREETRAELEAKRKSLLLIEAQLQPPRLSIEDITSQTLAVRLAAAHGESLASLTADGGEVINNLLGQYNKLDRTDDGLYVKAWTGDTFKQDRLGRAPVNLKRPCLSALWLVQRDKVETILSERTLTEGGAIPRLLLCHTNCQPRHIQPDTEPIPANVANEYRAMIRELLEAFRMAAEPVTIQPSADALRAMNEHYNRIVDRWHSGEIRDVGSYALRWTEQAWRIAVCLHAGQWRGEAGRHSLQLETAQAAIAIADWFAVQQLEILAAGRQAAKHATRTRILQLLADQPKGINSRDLQRAHIVDTADEAHALLETMAGEGIIEARDVKDTGGRPARSYRKARGK